LRVGMVGYSFMGQAHSQAWRTVARAFALPLAPRMVAIAGRSAEGVEAARSRLGWDEATTDWRSLIAREDIDVIDICTPGDAHAEIAIAALHAGKHVLCEKPLARSVAEGEAMTLAAESAPGVQAMVGFNYRRVPALALARGLIADRRLGEIRHVRAVYLQDWIVDPDFPLVWRLDSAQAGSGALGDIGAHIVDAAQFLLGETIASVSGLTRTFIEERPSAGDSSGLGARSGTAPGRGRVDVDDAALFLARFKSGAVGTFEATRMATGRKNGLAIEVNGSLGSLRFDLERLSELELFDAADEAGTQGFRRILVTEANHPYMDAWWPPGHLIGWEHSFTHEIRDLVVAIAEKDEARPNFADGLQVERVLAAVLKSAADGDWVDVG
jgi:predicted dehydrogenase